MKYVKSLDGLRALAVSLVMVYHFGYQSHSFEIGWVGVQIFFVLSGFLITSILLDSKSLSLPAYAGRFYWRRSLRIFPLYFAYLCAIAAIYFVAKTPPHFPKILPYLATYTYNFFPWANGPMFDSFFVHFWSLAVEEQFYLLWPFVIYFLGKGQLKKLVIAIILLGPLLRAGLYLYLRGRNDEETAGLLLYWTSASHLDAFAIGAAIPLFSLGERAKNWSKWLVGIFVFTILVGVFNYITADTVSGMPVSSVGYPLGGTENGQPIWSYTVLNILAAVLILALVGKAPSRLRKVFEWEPFVWVGRISYGMYVYHWVVLAAYKSLLRDRLPSEWLGIVLYFAIVTGIAWLSFELFESKILRWKDHVFSSSPVLKETRRPIETEKANS
jgi:peptidoglycan/LPS O-acetylase OafA/YrhL